jgi:WD40 repeat protein
VQLWDPATGAPVGEPLTGHTRQVTAVAALPLPDRRVLLATGSDDGTVRLWESATGEAARQRLRPLNRRLNRPNRTRWVSAVAAVPLPDAPVLLATSYYRTVRLWDPATGKAVRRGLRPLRLRHDSPVEAVAAVPLEDGRVLLATCTGHLMREVRLWDPATGTPVGDLLARDTRAVDAVHLPDGRVLLATGSGYDRAVRLWFPATGAPVGDPFTGHTRRVTAVTEVRLPDGRVLLATGSADGTVRLWDPATGTPVGDPLTGHTREVTAVTEVRLPDGRVLLATGSVDETVRLWDLPAGRQLRSLPVRDVVQALAVHGNELTVATRAGLLVLSLGNV